MFSFSVACTALALSVHLMYTLRVPWALYAVAALLLYACLRLLPTAWRPRPSLGTHVAFFLAYMAIVVLGRSMGIGLLAGALILFGGVYVTVAQVIWDATDRRNARC
jgi:hypothetical protein